MKRLTSKRDGQWMIHAGQRGHKPFRYNPLYNFYRVVDRVLVGKATRRNSW